MNNHRPDRKMTFLLNAALEIETGLWFDIGVRYGFVCRAAGVLDIGSQSKRQFR
jgi:hypothetical protein